MNSTDDWIPLLGGNVNTVALKGNMVRRKLSNASPAVHQLLQHLEKQNLKQVPRLIKFDREYEYLSFFSGEPSFRPWSSAIKTNNFMLQLGKWLKSYHTAVAGFRLEGEDSFIWGTNSPDDNMIVCHGDLGPWNCIQKNGILQGIIDWDLAHYGYAMDDVAELVFEFLPLHPQQKETIGENISKTILLKRLEAFCQGYESVNPDDIIKHIPIYLTRMNTEMRERANKDVEPFVSFVAGGIADKLDKHKAYFIAEWLTELKYSSTNKD